jgi:3-(3-hydroxy-phenyl)propionate hydroxylase/flavoprotein hydroxylase
MGRRQTVRDPVAAAERDRVLLAARAAARAPDKIRFPGLGPGMTTSSPGAGTLSVQGVVRAPDGRQGYLDEVVGAGFHLIVGAGAVRDTAALAAAGVRVVPLDAVVDVDGTYRAWFAELGCVAAAVRPDFYVFGTAVDPGGIDRLVADLLAAVGAGAPIPTR